MSAIIDYFFAPQSPYAYLGHDRLVAIATRHGAQIRLKPCDMGKVLAAAGGVPVAQRPPQRLSYRLVELTRWRDFLQMPLNLQPAYFPVSGDLASRVILAAQLAHGTARALELTGNIMRGVWAGELNIGDAETLQQIAERMGLDGVALLKAAEATAVASAYAECTQEAISSNVFGVPWYVLNDEPFWGQDRLDFLERALEAPTESA
jgi:2-hydroxychromene-2-carboxylate isomerase